MFETYANRRDQLGGKFGGVPNFSVRPVVIRRNTLKVGLLFLAFGFGLFGGVGLLVWGDLAAWERLLLVLGGGVVCLVGVWALLAGPTVVWIGDATVRLVERRAWWSRPQTSEWPLSEFDRVQMDYTEDEDGRRSYHVELVHNGGRRIRLSDNIDSTTALQVVKEASRALDLPTQ